MFHMKVRRARRRAIVVTVFGLVPALSSLLLLKGAGSDGDTIRSSEQIACALILAASAFSYFHWRLARSVGNLDAARGAGWMTVSLLLIALQGLGQSSLVRPLPADWRAPWPLVSALVLLALLIAVVIVSERADPPGDPAVVGTTVAMVVVAASAVVVHLVPAPALASAAGPGNLLGVTLVLVGIALAWLLLHHRLVSSWARPRITAAAVLLTLSCALTSVSPDRSWVLALGVFANVAGAVLLCSANQAMLRRSVLTNHHDVLALNETLAQARADVLSERELLHEVGATVAGIANASEVMRNGQLIPLEHRDRLQQMLEAELARLSRLMQDRAPSGLDDVSLEHLPTRAVGVAVDDVLRHLVTSHEARGLEVHWAPSNLRVAGDADELAEVVNILLTNARRHGGRTVWLDAAREGDTVTLSCADDGPGVPESLIGTLFTSGVRSTQSAGQGLGLAIARRHLASWGGTLELATSSSHPGATFVARIPSSEASDAHHVA